MEFRIEGTTLLARVVGDDASRELLLSLPGLIARKCIAHDCRAALVDLTGLAGPLDPVDRIFIASRLGEVWPRNVRLAALARPEQVNRVIEHMAGNRGVQIRAFTSEDEAFAWLGHEPPGAAP